VVYRKEGTYQVTLVGQDLADHALRQDFTIIVHPPSTIIDFQLDKEGGVAPLTVRVDSSLSALPPNEIITGYQWQCDDKLGRSTSGAAYSCSYDHEGTYRITLTIQTQSGREYTKSKIIVIRPPVVAACFFASRDTVKVGKPVVFTPCSSGDWKSMLWDFGDGTQIDWRSTDTPPEHTFDASGKFTVTQTLIDASGKQSKKTMTITVEP